MRSGELRHRVVLQTPTSTRNDAGQFLPSWADTITLWANVEPQSGREYENDHAVTGETLHKVTLRWYSTLNIKSDMRFKFVHNAATRYLEIESVTTTGERDREVICLCRETIA